MSLRSVLVFVPAAAAVMTLGGCSSWNPVDQLIYRPDVPQGNLVTKEMVDELEVGMTSAQVQFLLGEPLIRSQFHLNRWDYTYYMNPLKGDIQIRHVTVHFDDSNRLVRIDHGQLPTEQQADRLILKLPTDYVPAKDKIQAKSE